MEKELKRLKSLLKKVNRISILCHQNADPDAIGAAIALKDALEAKGHQVSLVAPEGISLPSERILESAGLPHLFQREIPQSDVLFMVDTSTIQQLGSATKDILLRSDVPIVVIDHHAPHPETLKFVKMALIDDQARSASEVMHSLLTQLDLKISERAAFILLCGIVFDTKHLMLADRQTLLTVLDLMDRGADLRRCVSLLQIPMSESERIARLKAARRMETTRVGPWTIAVTEVGSYHASVARALVALGADLAIAGGQKKDEIRISLRCSKEFAEASKIHLGRDVAMVVGKAFEGMGGGHAQAAGVNAYGHIGDALKMSKSIVVKLLNSRLSQR